MNEILKIIQTNTPSKGGKKHPACYFSFMFTLHFKGKAFPSRHTLVNSLILTRMEHMIVLCEQTP